MQNAIATVLALSGLVVSSQPTIAQVSLTSVSADVVRGSSAAERFFEQGRSQFEDEIRQLIQPQSHVPVLQVTDELSRPEEAESLDELRLRPQSPTLPDREPSNFESRES